MRTTGVGSSMAVLLLAALTGCSDGTKIPILAVDGDGLPFDDVWTQSDLQQPVGDVKPGGDTVLPDVWNPDVAPLDTTDLTDREVADLPPEICRPDCVDKECGPDGCGGFCGECTEDMVCLNYLCLDPQDPCVAACEALECGPVWAADGSECQCGDCPDPVFTACQNGICVVSCGPDCTGKQCGPDGCNGSCGTCGPNSTCTAAGQCVANCVPNCTGKQCGPDGCNGSCGTCGPSSTCTAAGQCVANCVPNCTGKQCGPDGCNGSCGTCSPNSTCSAAGKCVANCVPNCTGKQCGPDGCNGSCGTCQYGVCTPAGQCQCTPACAGKECGANGCGGVCGTCPGNSQCMNGQCISGWCDVYDMEFDAQIPYQKVTWMDFGKSGQPGEGLDVDQNPATCAPAGNCSAGVDNSFASFLASLVSIGVMPTNPFDSVIQSGDMILLAEPLGWNNWGTAFSMGFYTGDVAQSGGATCNFQTAYCNYYVQAESIHPETCLPYIFFYPVVMNAAGVLSGGGPQSHFEIALDFLGGVPLTLRFYMARIHAETIITSSGKVKIDKGIIAGAISTQELFDAILALPPGTLPMDPAMVVNLLGGLLVKDIDTNGDGIKDAASVALKFKSIEGKIIGVH